MILKEDLLFALTDFSQNIIPDPLQETDLLFNSRLGFKERIPDAAQKVENAERFRDPFIDHLSRLSSVILFRLAPLVYLSLRCLRGHCHWMIQFKIQLFRAIPIEA